MQQHLTDMGDTMGLEDSARGINDRLDRADAERKRAEAMRRDEDAPSTALSQELATLLRKLSFAETRFYIPSASKRKWHQTGTGWTISKSFPDQDSRTGWRGETFFLLASDGRMWLRCQTIFPKRFRDGVHRSGGLMVHEPHRAWATDTPSREKLFTQIAAVAMRKTPAERATGVLSCQEDELRY